MFIYHSDSLWPLGWTYVHSGDGGGAIWLLWQQIEGVRGWDSKDRVRL